MHKKILFSVAFFLFAIFNNALAANKIPVTIIVPFSTSVTLTKNTSTNIDLVIQNNAGVNQTITNIVPQIPSGNPISAIVTANNCGFLAPLATCEATVQVTGLSKPGNENLNVSVCSFNGALCSRITHPIVVTNAPLVRLTVFPTHPTIITSTTKQFYAIGLYADNTFQNLTDSATWSSSDPTKATISNAMGTRGLATGVAGGTSTITATVNGLSGSATLTVQQKTLSTITVNPVSPSIEKGTTQQFYAVGNYSDGSHQDITSSVIWSSSNQSIATISNASGQAGTATSINAGQATITATLEGIHGSAQLTVTAATLTSISVTPTNPTHAKGTTQQFTATGIYSDNTTADITNIVKWNTGSASIAVISNQSATKGLGLAVDEGTTTVNATLGSITGSTNFTVTPAILKAISIAPTNPSAPAGETQQFTATGIYTDHSTQDITNKVTWTSSNTALATISNAPFSHGLATGVLAGTVTISATENGITESTSFTVTSATLLSIDVNPASQTIPAGTQQQFFATGHFSDATTRDLTSVATWSSSANTIAYISNADGSKGLAIGVSAGGPTTITADYMGISGSSSLTVSSAILSSIAVTPQNASIPTGTNMQFTAKGTYTDATTQDITQEVTWSSSNTSKATISNATATKGIATGVAPGSTTITATLSPVTSGSITLTVINASIGGSLQGGVIACLDGGLNNLIAANTTNSTGIIWGGSGTMTNAQSDIDGGANTKRIVNVLGAATTYAAGLCDAYKTDSAGNPVANCTGVNPCYDDWFLAATNQISCMRDHRNQVVGYDKANYWSSTESSAAPTTDAWYITFANSGFPPATAKKAEQYEVRCVRLINGSP